MATTRKNVRHPAAVPAVPVSDGSTNKEADRRRFARPTDEENERVGLKRVHHVPDRGATIDAARAKAQHGAIRVAPQDMHDYAFDQGFDAGERFGYTFGFHNGGAEVANQLLAPGRGQRYLERSTTGNHQGRPRNGFEEHTADQLTAEIAGLLAAYAILPTSVKVRATLDALKSLGVTLHDAPGND